MATNKRYNQYMTYSATNLRDRGYPSSYTPTTPATNLRDKGYPSSTDGSQGTSNIPTTKVTLPTSTITPSYTPSSGGSTYTPSSSGGGGGGVSADTSYYDNLLDEYNDKIKQLQEELNDKKEKERLKKLGYENLLKQYKQKKTDYSKYYKERLELIKKLYNSGKTSAKKTYNTQADALLKNLTSSKNNLKSILDASSSSLNTDAENSLRQAYVNRMLSERNLGQRLSSMGINGGASESALLGISNNYGNARNDINTTLNKNLSDLNLNYNNNLSQAEQAYNEALANAQLQRAQQLQAIEEANSTNKLNAQSDYQNLLQTQNQVYLDLIKQAIDNGAEVEYDPLTLEPKKVKTKTTKTKTSTNTKTKTTKTKTKTNTKTKANTKTKTK